MDLQLFDLNQLGGHEWFEQQHALQRVAVKAHAAILHNEDDSISQQLTQSGKLNILVHQLIHVEVWLERLFPLLKGFIVAELDSVTAYSLLYQGAVLSNLLEVVLFNKGVFSAMEEECHLELCDYGWRCLQKLADPPFHAPKRHDVDENDEEESLESKKEEVDFAMAMSGLTICRYLAENAERLPLGVLTRMCEFRDTLGVLLTVLEHTPWEIDDPDSNQRHTYRQGAWQTANPFAECDASEHEAQAWLLLHYLLFNQTCRSKSGAEQRSTSERLLNLREKLTDSLVERLPFLKQLCFHLDVLALESEESDSVAPSRGIICEQVVTTRERLLHQGNWQQLADVQKENILRYCEQHAGKAQLQSMLETVDFMVDQEEAAHRQKVQKANAFGKQVNIAVWQQEAKGAFAPSVDFCAVIDDTKPPEDVDVKAGSGIVVCGTRFKLKPFAGSTLPSEGKLKFSFRGKRAEAFLELPTAPTKQAISEVAPVVWITAGLLATQGVVLQLKLERASSEALRDQKSGVWSPYQPVGGAVTITSGDRQ